MASKAPRRREIAMLRKAPFAAQSEQSVTHDAQATRDKRGPSGHGTSQPAASLSGIPKMGLLPLAGPRSVPPPQSPRPRPLLLFPARFARALLPVRRRSRLRRAGAPSRRATQSPTGGFAAVPPARYPPMRGRMLVGEGWTAALQVRGFTGCRREGSQRIVPVSDMPPVRTGL